jgi:hypothetical protein
MKERRGKGKKCRYECEIRLLDPGFSFFQETKASIAISSLVSSGWKELPDDWIRASLDKRILIAF